jgi:hypothetical protein
MFEQAAGIYFDATCVSALAGIGFPPATATALAPKPTVASNAAAAAVTIDDRSRVFRRMSDSSSAVNDRRCSLG